jgi:hypothetical protein
VFRVNSECSNKIKGMQKLKGRSKQLEHSPEKGKHLQEKERFYENIEQYAYPICSNKPRS